MPHRATAREGSACSACGSGWHSSAAASTRAHTLAAASRSEFSSRPGEVRPMTLRILVCDDQALVRAGFAKLIEATPGLTVVGEAADGTQAVDAAHRLLPDVALMDIRMPVLDGI